MIWVAHLLKDCMGIWLSARLLTGLLEFVAVVNFQVVPVLIQYHLRFLFSIGASRRCYSEVITCPNELVIDLCTQKVLPCIIFSLRKFDVIETETGTVCDDRVWWLLQLVVCPFCHWGELSLPDTQLLTLDERHSWLGRPGTPWLGMLWRSLMVDRWINQRSWLTVDTLVLITSTSVATLSWASRSPWSPERTIHEWIQFRCIDLI